MTRTRRISVSTADTAPYRHGHQRFRRDGGRWDVKRLTASLVLAGRVNGAPKKACHKAARHAARSYRRAFDHLAALPFLDSWTALGDESAIDRAQADALIDDFARAADLDTALADYALTYADQVEHDHAEMLTQIRAGHIELAPDM